MYVDFERLEMKDDRRKEREKEREIERRTFEMFPKGKRKVKTYTRAIVNWKGKPRGLRKLGRIIAVVSGRKKEKEKKKEKEVSRYFSGLSTETRCKR